MQPITMKAAAIRTDAPARIASLIAEPSEGVQIGQDIRILRGFLAPKAGGRVQLVMAQWSGFD